jgi:hypothetical protein
MNTRTCLKCGTVAFGVSRSFAEQEVERFNEYFATLSQEKQHDFYGGNGATIGQYERCVFCSSPHTNFRESRHGDCPDGCTLHPIIYEPMSGANS